MDITLENLTTIKSALVVAGSFGLENEIILSALSEVKKNNKLSIKEAIIHSLGEWDLL